MNVPKIEDGVVLLCQRFGGQYRKFGSNTFLIDFGSLVGRKVVWETKGEVYWSDLSEFRQPIQTERNIQATVINSKG